MKKILITGGTGSLGQHLVKRLYGKYNITIFSRDETKQGRMKKQYPECNYILGDVANLDDLTLAFRNIDVVYHFAAYKQVPSAQNNVIATIKTNIVGSKNVAYAAILNNVKQVVASSTDKACAPVNMYGVSKAAMESIFQDANKYGPTTFHLTRYGNVVSSNQSVIPLFKKQAEAGGPLTVTLNSMTRFWLGINTAVDLVEHALTQEPGVIVVPIAYGMSVKKVAQIIGGGLPIEEIGIRAGEKVHEAMVNEAESMHTETIYTDDIANIPGVFLIHPPTQGNTRVFSPFTYTSDTCDELSEQDLLNMVEEYEI